MAPRSSQQRRTLGPQEHIYELGVAGRKTGVILKDTGIRDEHGMEPLDDIFSSPTKPDKNVHVDEEGQDDESDDNDTGEAMDITTTSGIGPAALLSGHGNRLPMPPPRSRSPVKTSLGSPAQRFRMPGRNNSSPEEPNSQHTVPKRRLDFKSLGANGPRSNSQPILGKGIPKLSAVNGSARTNGYHSQPTYQQEESEEEQHQPASEQPHWDDNADDDEVDNFVEESMAMLSQPEASPEPEQISRQSSPEETARTAAARKQPGPKVSVRGGSNNQAKPSKPSPPAKATKNRRVVEEEEEEEEEEESDHAQEEPAPEDPEEEEEEEEEEEVVPKPRGRPAKPKAPAQEPEPKSRKRRSLTEEEAEEDTSGREKKRQRAEPSSSAPAPAPKGRGWSSKKTVPAISEEPEHPKASTSKKAGKAPVAEKVEKAKKGRKRKSSLAGDTSLIAIPRGPPLPKARGLLINRREVPGDSSSMTRTRSGRNSFKPLAYWRNERVDYDLEEEMTDAFQKSRPGKFLLPSIKEVVRVDEPEPVYPTKPRKGKRGAAGKGKRGRKSRGYDSEDDIPPEPWETKDGAVFGNSTCWLPEHEFNPPAQDDDIDEEERQLAISGAGIQTQPVRDATFRYAKVLSEGFYNAGIVDLPPGSEKRPKNSRKNFMSFFVHTGRVLVTVNDTSFRISKGGIFFVPRGNYYSIENDYDQHARLFFSQGCEVAPPEPEPEPLEEGNEEEEEPEE